MDALQTYEDHFLPSMEREINRDMTELITQYKTLKQKLDTFIESVNSSLKCCQLLESLVQKRQSRWSEVRNKLR